MMSGKEVYRVCVLTELAMLESTRIFLRMPETEKPGALVVQLLRLSRHIKDPFFQESRMGAGFVSVDDERIFYEQLVQEHLAALKNK